MKSILGAYVSFGAQDKPQIVPTRCSCLHHQSSQETQLALGFAGLSVGDRDPDFSFLFLA